MVKYHSYKLLTLLSQLTFLVYSIYGVTRLDYANYADISLLLSSSLFLNLGLPYSINTIVIRDGLNEGQANFVFWRFVIIILIALFITTLCLKYGFQYEWYWSMSIGLTLFFQFIFQMLSSLLRSRDIFIKVAQAEFVGQFIFLCTLFSSFNVDNVLLAFILKWGISLCFLLYYEFPNNTKSYDLRPFFVESVKQLSYNYFNLIPSLALRWFLKSTLEREIWSSASLLSSLFSNGLVVIRNQVYVAYNAVYLQLINQSYFNYQQYSKMYRKVVLSMFNIALLIFALFKSYLIPIEVTWRLYLLVLLAETWTLVYWHFFTQSTAKGSVLSYAFPFLLLTPAGFIGDASIFYLLTLLLLYTIYSKLLKVYEAAYLVIMVCYLFTTLPLVPIVLVALVIIVMQFRRSLSDLVLILKSDLK